MQPHDQPGDAIGADNRTQCGGSLATAVGRPRGVGRKQCEQGLLVACLDGREEALQQCCLCGLADIEALAIAAHSFARTMDDLPAGRFGLLDDGGDFR